MKRHTAILALAIGMVFCARPAQAQARTHRVLFALTSPEEADWQMILNNLRNLVSGFAPETVDVEIVAYGPGIAFLKKDGPEAGDIQKLESAHVHFVACRNAMRKQHLAVADLVPGSEVVLSGVVEVVEKQEQGWTYIKAGR